MHRFENYEEEESQMVKSEELFTKNKQARLKELRSEAKNPLGKEDFFPELSFKNLKFVRDSMDLSERIFDEIEDDSNLKND